MSKITLEAAYSRIEEINLTDVFASLVHSKLIEDEKLLKELKYLHYKVYLAEKHFNIDDIKEQINLLSLEYDYYEPANILYYYRDNISEEIKISNFDTYIKISNDIDILKAKIKDISKHIYIEV